MKSITYITGNMGKYENAKVFLGKYDIEVRQQKLSLDEIQGDDASLSLCEKQETHTRNSAGHYLSMEMHYGLSQASMGFPDHTCEIWSSGSQWMTS